jgi:hypothetical protein
MFLTSFYGSKTYGLVGHEYPLHLMKVDLAHSLHLLADLGRQKSFSEENHEQVTYALDEGFK